MPPFDLPPTNFLDLLHADLCRPAEVRKRESYLSKAPDDDHEHVEVVVERRNTAITPQTGALRLSTV